MKKRAYNPFNEKEKYTPPFAEIIRCKGATLLDGSAKGVQYGEEGDAGGYIGEDDIEDYGELNELLLRDLVVEMNNQTYSIK